MIEPRSIRQYHVFLASPGDVPKEREEVRRFFADYNRQTAHQHGFEFVLLDWEHYANAAMGPPQAVITRQTLERVKGSLALFIGILWQRFGTPTGKHQSGTEEEFEWAREQQAARGHPEIKFFFREPGDLKVSTTDTTKRDEQIAQWEKTKLFRVKFPTIGLYTGYKKPTDFPSVLANDLRLWLDDPRQPWWVAGKEADEPPPRPAPRLDPFHQLPSPPADFTGRAAELAELKAAIAPSLPAVSTAGAPTVSKPATGQSSGAILTGVNGMGGVGKTALALKLAHDLRPLFPDADFYVDLRGTAVAPDRPVPPDEALQHVIRAFAGPEAKLPSDLPTLQSLYHSSLTGKRAIVLWDNARDADQVKDLAPPAGCLMLVTSRKSFALPGMTAKRVDQLPPVDARAMLQTIARAAGRTLDDAAADTIAQLCGRLPQALRLAGGALAARADLTPAELARRLRDLDQRLKTLDRYKDDSGERSLRASMEMTEGLLPEAHRAKWHAMAVFPGNFDAAAAAAVWDEVDEPLGSSPLTAAAETTRDTGSTGDAGSKDDAHVIRDRVADVLSDLTRGNAIEFDEGSRRYQFHDLVRAFGIDRLLPTARASAERRFAEHYVQVAKACDKLYLVKGQHAVALAHFDAEWHNVAAGFQLAERYLETEPWAAEAAMQFAGGSPYCLHLRLAPQRKPAWFDAGLRAARAVGHRQAEGAMLGNLGLAHAALGDARMAIEFYGQQLLITREIADRHGEGNALGNLGIAYAALGNARKAKEFYEQQLLITREIGDRRGEGNALGSLGVAYAVLGDARKAIELYEQQLLITREIGDRRGEGNALGSLGSAYADLRDARKAIEFYEQRLAIAREIGDRRGEGTVLGNMGTAYEDLEDVGKAIAFYKQQLVIAREIGDRRGEAIASWNLGLRYENEGDLTRAIKFMQVLVDFERSLAHSDTEKHVAHVEQLRARVNQSPPK